MSTSYDINVSYWDTLCALDWAVDTARRLDSPNVQGIIDNLEIEDLAADLAKLGHADDVRDAAHLVYRVQSRRSDLDPLYEMAGWAEQALEAFFTTRGDSRAAASAVLNPTRKETHHVAS